MLFTTIIVLYIASQGRVAYWADWRLWGLTKSQWGNIHINIGLLFLFSIFLHIAQQNEMTLRDGYTLMRKVTESLTD